MLAAAEALFRSGEELPDPSLCVSCKAAKMLCGKPRCPILVKLDFMMKTKPLIDSTSLDGSSPPGVFVGRIGWPKVYVGPLIPPVHGDTAIMDLPEAWGDMGIDDIVAFRSQLVRGMHRIHVGDVAAPDRLVELTREIALAQDPSDVEATFVKKPRATLKLDDDVQPFGPSATLRSLGAGNIRWDPRLGRATDDGDLGAREALLGLYADGVPVSRIARAFSVGAFGREDRRRFVPTRWSITAVDDTIGKGLLQKVKGLPTIDEFRLYESRRLDNRFEVLLMPRAWAYELIEAWYPGTTWNPAGSRIVVFGDHEGYSGRSTYASIGGCYYAARLATAEALLREGRQAAAVILREAHPGYIMPVGVWQVREQVRNALRQEPKCFEDLRGVLQHVAMRLAIPLERWLLNSAVLRLALQQRRLEDFPVEAMA